jgi:protein-tyrosine phosphatase
MRSKNALRIHSFRWVVQGELAASAMPLSIEEINKAGIKVVVSLVPESEQLFRTKAWLAKARNFGITFHTINIEDLKVPTKEQFAYFLRIMNEAKTGQPRRVLLHCIEGVGRAGTMAAAYLIARKGFVLEDAYKTIIRGLREAQFDVLASNPRFIAQLKSRGQTLQDFFKSFRVMFPESLAQEKFLKQIEARFLVFSRNHVQRPPKKKLKRRLKRWNK